MTKMQDEELNPEYDKCDDCGSLVNLHKGEDFFVEIKCKGGKMVCEKCYQEKYAQYYK